MIYLLTTVAKEEKNLCETVYDNIDTAQHAFDFLIGHSTIPLRACLVEVKHFPYVSFCRTLCLVNINGMPESTPPPSHMIGDLPLN
jgi:hypothetical protein